MKKLARTTAACAALAGFVWSDAAEAAAKARNCFTKPEIAAEQLVRQGLLLREGATGCDGSPWYARTEPLWKQIDQQFGQQFAEQTRVRRIAFEREFPGKADTSLAAWDGRIVVAFRGISLSQIYCERVKKLMQDMQKGGWNVFVRQAAKAPAIVRMDFRQCG